MAAAASAGRRALTYVVHGEPAAADAFAASLKSELGWNAHVAEYLEAVELT